MLLFARYAIFARVQPGQSFGVIQTGEVYKKVACYADNAARFMLPLHLRPACASNGLLALGQLSD